MEQQQAMAPLSCSKSPRVDVAALLLHLYGRIPLLARDIGSGRTKGGPMTCPVVRPPAHANAYQYVQPLRAKMGHQILWG